MKIHLIALFFLAFLLGCQDGLQRQRNSSQNWYVTTVENIAVLVNRDFMGKITAIICRNVTFSDLGTFTLIQDENEKYFGVIPQDQLVYEKGTRVTYNDFACTVEYDNGIYETYESGIVEVHPHIELTSYHRIN